MTLAVLTLPTLNAERRIDATLAEGLTVAEIVTLQLPDLPLARLSMVRVTIDHWEIEQAHWSCIRPRAGHTLVVRILPGKSSLRSILSIVVTIAAMSLGQFYAPALAGAFGIPQAVAGGIITAGVTLAGTFLINALVPVPHAENRKESPTYTVEGWTNVRNPNGAVPFIAGTHRIAPPLSAFDFTESIGDDRWTSAVVSLYGPIAFDKIQIGETKLEELNEGEYQVETRLGYSGDTPLTLFSQQALEDQVSVELVPHNQDDRNEFYPITRTAPGDASELSIDLAFPGGLTDFNDKGGLQRHSVSIRIEHRLVGTADFVQVIDLVVDGKSRSPMTRGYRWHPPVRGRYEIRLTRMTGPDPSNNAAEVTQWLCLRAHRPEYPFNFDRPLAHLAAKVKASRLTNGRLAELNFWGSSLIPDWDPASESWVTRATSNPASIYRHAHQGPQNAKPKGDHQINLSQLQDWHQWCAANGLEYQRVHDYDASFEEALADICRAGRATPHHDGTRWGVVIDRPRSVVTAHITPRNAWGIKGSITPLDPPDAFRVRFRDRTNNYEEAERVVRRPGLVGDVIRTEDLQAPGETHPDQVWRTATRRFLEMEYRAETWTANQDFEHLVVKRGDLAVLALPSLAVSCRVKFVSGMRVQLDDLVAMEAGNNYCARFRGADGSDRFWTIETVAGAQGSITLTGDGTLPQAGDLAIIGRYGDETIEVIIKDIERTDNLNAQITMVPHAPEIDAFLAAQQPPAWDGRVGSEVEIDLSAPSVPIIIDITSAENTIDVVLAAAGGTRVTAYEIQHRLAGSGSWAGSVSSLAVNASLAVTGYAIGANVEMQRRAIGATGLPSLWSGTFSHVVGSDSVVVSAPINFTAAAFTDGTVRLSWMNSNQPGSSISRLFRAVSGSPIADAVDLIGPINGSPNQAMTITDLPGDGAWDYWVLAETGSGLASDPAGPKTVTIAS